MSRAMLHAVLKMPPELWGTSEQERRQRYARCYHASEVIQGQDEAIAELTEQREQLQSLIKTAVAEGYFAADAPCIQRVLAFGADEDFKD